MKKAVILMVLIFSLGSLISAQEAWKTKNFDQWTKADVEDILNNSSWVSKQEVRLSYDPTSVSVAGSVTPNIGLNNPMTIQQGAIAPAVDFTFTLRLRSSMAIRLALIRRDQLETDVKKKLTDKEFETYKARQKGLYECPGCVDNYVLTLSSSSRQNKNYDAVYSSFQKAQLDQLKRYIYLINDKGEKRELVNFVPPKAPGEEALFFFTRFDEKGNLLFTKESKYLILNFANNEVSTSVNFRFDITPLIVGERVDF